jgi:hypothetical protein
MSLTAVLAQIPLAPPLDTRLIALVVVEVLLAVLVVLLWIRYDQLKRVPVDEWWERRQRAGVSPRVRRMMDASHEQYLAEQRGASESGELRDGETRSAEPKG